jgi:UDPglucose 6-dehydrogenase
VVNENTIKISVIGTGYVGLTLGVCLADFGYKVTCVDIDDTKICSLKMGIVPIHEPGLEDLLKKTIKMGTINFTTDTRKAILETNVIFIAVGTPSREDGAADISFVLDAVRLVAQNLNEYKIIVLKSTVPVGTSRYVYTLIAKEAQNKCDFAVVSNPEFLRQGKALMDFISPHRTIIGSEDRNAVETMRKIYAQIDTPFFVTNPENAEIIKYASNSFLAMKISYINEIANLCEGYGADVKDVARGMGMDPRIGDRFLEAGIGFGGSCFPKDMKALLHCARQVGYDFKLLKAAMEINERQKNIAVLKLKKHLGGLKGKTIGLWGLSFKPDTDDIREASSVTLITGLLAEGAQIKAHDPKAEKKMREVFSELIYCDTPYDVAEGSHGIVLVTEWADFIKIDLNKVKKIIGNPLIIDGRNLFDPLDMKKMGFLYEGIGRL